MVKNLKILTFTDETREEILSLSDDIEFIHSEGELLVDNGYVKIGQQVILSSSGNVYKIEHDLAKDINTILKSIKINNF